MAKYKVKIDERTSQVLNKPGCWFVVAYDSRAVRTYWNAKVGFTVWGGWKHKKAALKRARGMRTERICSVNSPMAKRNGWVEESQIPLIWKQVKVVQGEAVDEHSEAQAPHQTKREDSNE